MEPDYLQLQIKSVILHLYSTLALPSWHGNSVSIQLTMFFPEYIQIQILLVLSIV